MGKMLILLLTGTGMIFGIIGLNIFQSGSSNMLNSVAQVSIVYAKNNSASGVEIAYKNLAYDSSWVGASNVGLKHGNVTVTVVPTTSKYYNGPNVGLPKARLVTSIGEYNGYIDTIRAVIKLPSGVAPSAPAFLRYSIASDQNISFGGNINIRDDNNPLWNASVLTNQSFAMNGNNYIEGFLNYGGTATSDPMQRLITNIVPNTNPDNLPNRYQLPGSVPIPTLVPENYISIADVIYSGDANISGDVTLGTKEHPLIVYVGGSLRISGNFTGYGAFIVKGSVTTTGSFTLTNPNMTGNNLGIYAGGDVNLMGGVIQAQLFTNGNVYIGANTQLHGGITAKGTVTFQGGADFFYRPATAELTDPIWPRDPDLGLAPRIVSYYSN